MTTTVRLYYDTHITPDKNGCVENVSQYLQNYEYIETTLAKYIKHDTSVTFKMDASMISNSTVTDQVLDPFSYGRIDYAAVKNQDDNDWVYYYVMNKNWTATKTVTVYLAIDSLTTFQNCFDFADKTVVTREHKDRVLNSPTTILGQAYLPRKIYLDGDNIETTLYKEDEIDLEDADAPYDWYLMYVANNTTGAVEGKDYPVNAYLVSGEDITVGAESFRLKMTDLDAAKVYYLGSLISGTYASDDYVTLPNGKKEALDGIYYIIKVSGKDYWRIVKRTPTGTKILADVTDHLDFSSIKDLVIITTQSQGSIAQLSYVETPSAVLAAKTGTISPSTEAEGGSIDGIDTVDRTDTRILSILKLPYAPVNIVIDEASGQFQLPSEIEGSVAITWQNQQPHYYLKIKTQYLDAFQKDLKVTKQYLRPLFVKKTDLTSQDVRNDEGESALYRSDYFQWRFVYDSFSYPWQFELTDIDKYKNLTSFNDDMKFKVVTTTTMNSRFLFDFNNNDKGIVYKHQLQDYPYILTVARNNSITTFNSEYVNYMRNGYNYDVKAKNAALLNSTLGIISGAAGAGLAIAGSGVGSSIAGMINSARLSKQANQALESGVWWESKAAATPGSPIAKLQVTYGMSDYNLNKAVGLESQAAAAKAQINPVSNMLALGQAINGVTSIVNGIQQIQQTEASFERKQQAIKQASTSVVGSDDIDLLSYYSNNRMKIEKWQCSDRMRQALGDLYYYQGYSTNEQKVPTHNNRKWFDFLQCQAVINPTRNIDERFLDDIRERLAIGVTYFHNVNGAWDLNQVKANNETWLA